MVASQVEKCPGIKQYLYCKQCKIIINFLKELSKIDIQIKLFLLSPIRTSITWIIRIYHDHDKQKLDEQRGGTVVYWSFGKIAASFGETKESRGWRQWKVNNKKNKKSGKENVFFVFSRYFLCGTFQTSDSIFRYKLLIILALLFTHNILFQPNQ